MCAKRAANCLDIVCGVQNILWPEAPPADGRTVRRQLFSYLARKRQEAPQRGRGAYLRKFVEHFQKVTRSYAPGLFHTYDDPRIPQTSNELEGINGAAKQNLRHCTGRPSTAHGPGASSGPIYMFGVALHRVLPEKEINALLTGYDSRQYLEGRRLIEQIREPSKRRRSFLRNPFNKLAEVLAGWIHP